MLQVWAEGLRRFSYEITDMRQSITCFASSQTTVSMSFLCRRFYVPLLCRHIVSTAKPHQQAVVAVQKSDPPECDRFGTVSESEVLSSEYLPDDDDNYDKLEGMKRRRPIEYYDRMMKQLWKSGGPEKMGKMMDLFEQMQHEDRHPQQAHHITMLISGCAEFGLVDKAFHFFDLLLKNGKHPTKAGVTALLNACAESRDRHKALEKLALITDWIRETSYPCNKIHYTAMVKAYARQGDLRSAFAVLKDMANEGHELDDRTYCMLLMGCITDRFSGFSHAIRILREMRKHVPLTEHAVNLFLRIIRDSGVGTEDHLHRLLPPEAAEKVILLPCNQLQVEKYRPPEKQIALSPVNLLTQKYPDQAICLDMSSLRIACNKLSLVGGYAGILKLMDESGIKSSIVTIMFLMQVLPDCTETENQLMIEAEKRGVQLDTDFFNVLIRKRAFRFEVKSARNLLSDMQIRHIAVDVATFGTLALTCHDRDVGLQLMADMRSSGIKLNKQIAGALVCNACFRYDFEYLTDVLREMERYSVRPDAKMLEKIERAKLTSRQALLRADQGQELEKHFRLLNNDVFDRFLLFYKSWLRRNHVEFAEPVDRQFDFNIKPHPRQKMFEFERDMRRRISEHRGYRFKTTPNDPKSDLPEEI
jgi:pentatricopeptide repeat protein